jgi:hypothetical protein
MVAQGLSTMSSIDKERQKPPVRQEMTGCRSFAAAFVVWGGCPPKLPLAGAALQR